MGKQRISLAVALLALGSSGAGGVSKAAGRSVLNPAVPSQVEALQGGALQGGAAAAAEGGSTGLKLHLVETAPAIQQDAPPAQGSGTGGSGPMVISLAPLVRAVRPTVVGVATRGRQQLARGGPEGHGGLPPELFERFFGQPPPGGPGGEGEGGAGPLPGMPPEGMPPPGGGGSGVGSGVIIDPQGLVLTNNHVVEDAAEVTVTLDNNKEYKADVVGRDPETDIAVIRLRDVKAPLPAARLGTSDPLQVGDPVMAIGNPFGLDFSVTSGIISAKARVIGAGPFDDFLQTDAAINPGNSGGPLFDMQGNVVGINTAIVAGGSGIGFAVPVDLVRALLPQLVEKGQVVRGFLGVGIQDLTEDLARALKIRANEGALVASVDPKGPAAPSGLKPGDVVVSLNGKPVESAAQLSRGVALLKPQEQAKLDVLREGQRQAVAVSLGTRPSRQARRAPEPARPAEPETGELGLALQTPPPELLQKAASKGGALVVEVTPGSAAERAGLQPGDLIVEANKRAVASPKDVAQVARETRSEQLLLRVMRGSTGVFVVMPPRGPAAEKAPAAAPRPPPRKR
jgi:serine protease Do